MWLLKFRFGNVDLDGKAYLRFKLKLGWASRSKFQFDCCSPIQLSIWNSTAILSQHKIFSSELRNKWLVHCLLPFVPPCVPRFLPPSLHFVPPCLSACIFSSPSAAVLNERECMLISVPQQNALQVAPRNGLGRPGFTVTHAAPSAGSGAIWSRRECSFQSSGELIRPTTLTRPARTLSFCCVPAAVTARGRERWGEGYDESVVQMWENMVRSARGVDKDWFSPSGALDQPPWDLLSLLVLNYICK